MAEIMFWTVFGTVNLLFTFVLGRLWRAKFKDLETREGRVAFVCGSIGVVLMGVGTVLK